MTAVVYNIRDYQSKSAIERSHKALEEHLNNEAIQIANIAFPYIIEPTPFYDPNPKETA